MIEIPYVKCDYCCYDFPYKKRTMIFGNIQWSGKLCGGAGVCPKMIGNIHICTAQQGRQALSRKPLQKETWTREELYRMPPALCRELVDAITAQVNGDDGTSRGTVQSESAVVSLDGLSNWSIPDSVKLWGIFFCRLKASPGSPSNPWS